MAQFLPAPQRRGLGAVDFIPNLLVTTLAVITLLPARAGRATESAPAIRCAVQNELLSRPLTLGLNPQPQIQGWTDSAPPRKSSVQVDQIRAPLTLGAVQSPLKTLDTSPLQAKYQVFADTLPYPLTLGINPQPAPQRADQSAPANRAVVGIDIPANLLTLLSGVPFKPLDTGCFQGKYTVQADVPVRPLTLGVNPQPGVQRLDQAAPQPKYAVQVDEPVQHPLTLGFNPQPVIQRLDTSAPYPKYQIQCDLYPNTLVLGIQSPPQVRGWTESAPATPFAIRVDLPANLLSTTLAVPAVPLALPLGVPVDTAQWQGKFQIQQDLYPNILVLGYPAAITPVIPPVQTGTNDNNPRSAQGHYRLKGKRRKQKIPELPPAVFISPASFERAPPQAVIDKVPDFTGLAQTLGAEPAALSRAIDVEIKRLMAQQAERDDEEALMLILSALDD